MSSVRVRIAPSPSGFLHIGTAKIALMNWLYARKTGGTFVLRLEDTDADRTDEGFVEAMCQGFKWLGIDWDEGPAFGDEDEKGEYGPYRQSERVALHRAAIARLVEEGKAYRCFCTKEKLDAERERARAEKRNPRYKGTCRGLDAAEAARRADERHVVRFKVPEGATVIQDIVQGDVRVENSEFDDFVIAKPNGDPIFHLAVVVDDAEMKITHVIRGDDHLTNATRHIMLFEALGYPVPQFAHLPMVLDERGRKFSKRRRSGANVLDWKKMGYLPETIINYVVLQGWTAGDNREVYTRDELKEAFSLERLGKSPAKFDLKKLQWLNGQHIRKLKVEDLRDRIVETLNERLEERKDKDIDPSSKSGEWLTRMAEVCQEKLSTLHVDEIVGMTDFFFVQPTEFDPKAVKKQWTNDDSIKVMEAIHAALDGVENWKAESIRQALDTLRKKTGHGFGKYVHSMRLALTGKSVGPGVFELAELLGKETCLERTEPSIVEVEALALMKLPEAGTDQSN